MQSSNKKSQIVFLDVDGVLTSARCNGYYDFDLWAVHFMLYACKEGNAKIVMSSAWRKLPEAKKWFSDLFGKYLHTDWRTGDLDHRGLEINEWLAKHPEVENYVVIDDDTFDLVEHHRMNLVATSSRDGFLSKDMLRTRDLLGIKKDMPRLERIEVKDVCFYTRREKRAIGVSKWVAELEERNARKLVQEAADEEFNFNTLDTLEYEK